MSILTPSPPRPAIVYPDSDGKPMADNTVQFRWIVTIKEGLERAFLDRTDVFVAGDLLWYPVEGNLDISAAPDAMVVFGRPKGDRGSYRQWEEGGIAPQVVFEVLSPNNRVGEMERKRLFYDQYGVQEYYIYDPEYAELFGHQRVGGQLVAIRDMNGWISPLLGVRFDMSGSELRLIGPDGQPFVSFQEIARERDRFAQERDRFARERDLALIERDAQRQRAEKMAEQLRSLGIEPNA
ncbi:MAG: Uma2 family endonuclease [Isosphaeraceae bacterium]